MSHARDNARLARTGIPTVETAQDLRDLTLFSGDPPEAVQTLGALTEGDDGAGIWRWDATSIATDDLGTVLLPAGRVGAGRWVRDRPAQYYNTAWFGPGVAGIAAAFDAYRASGLLQMRICIEPKAYDITTTVDVYPTTTGNAKEMLSIEASGCTFNVSADVGFRTHDGTYVRNVTKRRLYWRGGFFEGNGTNVGIEAHWMRMCKISECHFTGFGEGLDIWGFDTYHIVDNFFYSNNVSLNIPSGTSVLGEAPAVEDQTLNVILRRNHFSIDGTDHGIKVRARTHNFVIADGSFNGESVGPMIDFSYDLEDGQPRSLSTAIIDNHFEQHGNNPISMQVDAAITPGTGGYSGVRIQGNMFRADTEQGFPTDGRFLNLPGVRDGIISSNSFYPAGITAGMIVARFGNMARDVGYGTNNVVGLTNGDYLDVSTVTDRRYFKYVPREIVIPITTPVGWNGNLITASSDTILAWDAVRTKCPDAPCRPASYFVDLEVSSADSSTAAAGVSYAIHGTAGINEGLRVYPAGTPNNQKIRFQGVVPADLDGNLSWYAVHTVLGEVTVTLRLLAVVF